MRRANWAFARGYVETKGLNLAVAVGMPVPDTPRTKPYVRYSRIRLPPRMSGVKAFSRMRMRYTGSGNPSGEELMHMLPGHSAALAACQSSLPAAVELDGFFSGSSPGKGEAGAGPHLPVYVCKAD